MKGSYRDQQTGELVLDLPDPGRLRPDQVPMGEAWIVARYVGAAGAEYDHATTVWKFKCPECTLWEFGLVGMELTEAVGMWLRGGRLPKAPVLAGICMSCEYATYPEGRHVRLAGLSG